MAIVESKAYVLHQRPYRESSVLVDLLTAENGRLAAVCKGVRGGGKRAALLRGGLQPFTLIKVEWTGKSELKSLRSAEALSVSPQLSQQFLYAAMYVNELMVRLFQAGEAHEHLFVSYKEVIETIVRGNSMLIRSTSKADQEGERLVSDSASGEQQLQVALRYFEFQLL